jgi:hypothetical protein
MFKRMHATTRRKAKKGLFIKTNIATSTLNMSATPHVDYNDDGAQYVLAFGKYFYPVGEDHQMSKWTTTFDIDDEMSYISNLSHEGIDQAGIANNQIGPPKDSVYVHEGPMVATHHMPEVLDTPTDHDENNDADVMEDGGENDDGYNRHDVPDTPRNGGENIDGLTMIIHQDVIMGRGGHNQTHHGNRVYLMDRDTLGPRYITAYGHKQKQQIGQELIQSVYIRGGHFMDKVDGIYGREVTDGRRIHTKAAQALSEFRVGLDLD